MSDEVRDEARVSVRGVDAILREPEREQLDGGSSVCYRAEEWMLCGFGVVL